MTPQDTVTATTLAPTMHVGLLNSLRTIRGWIVVVSLGLAIYVAIGSLTWPMGRDQGIFTFAGEAILDGGVPYKDAWDIKGPLTHYTYAFALAAFGRHEVSIRIFDLCAILSCCWILRQLILRLNEGDRLGAHYAIALFALAYYSIGFWCTAQPDGWGGILVAATVGLLLYSTWTRRTVMLISGALIASATLLKPTFALFISLPLLFPSNEPTRIAQHLRLCLWCLVAFSGVLCMFMLAFFELSDGPQDFLDVMQFLVGSYAPSRNISDQLRVAFLVLYAISPIPYLLALLGIWRLYRQKRRVAKILGAWLAVSVLDVVIQGRYFQYHWIPALISTIPAAGVAAARGEFKWLQSGRDYVRSTLLALAVLFVVIAPNNIYGLFDSYRWPAYALGLYGEQPYKAKITHGWPYTTYVNISHYVATHSRSTDKVLLWGFDTVINVLSGREAPTRFGVSYPLVVPGPVESKYRRLFMSEISRDPPVFIILDAKEPWDLVDLTGLQLLDHFPEFNGFLHRRYRFEFETNGFQVWTLIR